MVTLETAKPEDAVGGFHYDHDVSGRLVSLGEWRVTTASSEVADSILQLFGGGKPRNWETEGSDAIEVLTGASAIEIIVEGASKLRRRMIHRGRTSTYVFGYDGSVELSDVDRSRPTGWEPETELTFRLARSPGLGTFWLRSRSWSMANDLARNQTEDRLASASGATLARLALVPVSFIAKSGPRAGDRVNYTWPALTLVEAS
ncbi:hypothetical protein [Curtobacterium sp. MCBD17_019]|uniref:recombination directionality factor n=1 Tax=Curtobacterium sp. MCBD17_019 TaxID=2175669 RepID=UPI000DA96844|nr:hypothetical protein [Curtobacterium sp. MCBD17_019]PZE71604.1 hypothetical protein DEI82_15365 [Curtobacterium sp. MCBD17_019]